MVKEASITLGDLSFTAHKFNLGETEEIADLQAAMNAASLGQRLAAMRQIVLVSARRDRPGLDDDAMRKIVATPAELTAAVAAILRLNGYGAAKLSDAAPGEATADDQAA